MRIDQMKNFIKTADTLSFTKAAQESFVTQSVLSKQIASMENELNTVLFERTKNGVKLTPAGAVAYEAFASVLHSYDKALRKIKQCQESIQGELRFEKLFGLKNPDTLNIALENFSTLHPEIMISRKSKNNNVLIKDINDGNSDVFLIWKHAVMHNDDLNYIPLRYCKVYLALSAEHKLAGRKDFDINSLQKLNWITIKEEEASSLYKLVEQYTSSFSPPIIEADNLGDMFDLIHDGVGVGIVSEGHIMYGLSSLIFIPFLNAEEWILTVAYRKNNKNPALALFVQELEKAKQLVQN